MTVIDNEVVKTLYWDTKDNRFVYIVWNVKLGRGMHHKIPRTEVTKDQAHKYIAERGF